MAAVVTLLSASAHAAGALSGSLWKGAIHALWIGGKPVFHPGFTSGLSSASIQASGDGMLKFPGSIVVDSSGNLIVADSQNDRITRYSSAGAFTGWIGKIATSPTGGAAGCAGATVGAATPGWCTGGSAVTASGDGQLGWPYGLTIDRSGNVIVAEYEYGRIMRYPAVTK